MCSYAGLSACRDRHSLSNEYLGKRSIRAALQVIGPSKTGLVGLHLVFRFGHLIIPRYREAGRSSET
jgi:hypothetical protein